MVASSSESDPPAADVANAVIESEMNQANWFVAKQLRRNLTMATTGNIPVENGNTRLAQPPRNSLQSI